MAGEASRWVSYDEAAALLGISAEATRRLALHRGWPRRSRPDGAPQVAVPESPPGEVLVGWETVDLNAGEEDGTVRGEARSLLDYLEAHVERLTEELSEARTEMRGVRYEAESLRVEAGRAQVFAALVEAERARVAEIKAERDRLADQLALGRRPWFVRVVGAICERRAPGRRPF